MMMLQSPYKPAFMATRLQLMMTLVVTLVA
jgi:hypothetical protein